MATNIKDVAKNAGTKVAEFYEDNKDEILIYGFSVAYVALCVGLSIWQHKRYEQALMKGAAIGAANAISKALM